MIKNMFIKKYFLVLVIMMSLLFIFGLGNKKIFADDDWVAVNISDWDVSGPDSDGVILINGYNGSGEKIVIPNANDFIEAGKTTCSKVKISKSNMQAIANNSGVTGIKISDKGTENDDKKKVFADGDDWKATFFNKSSLTSLDLNNFDISDVNDVSNMFANCSNLTGLDISRWGTSNVNNMGSMFYGCSKLTRLDLSAWHTSEVTNMTNMFGGCSNLTGLDISCWNTSNVESMSNMFYNCSKLTRLDLGDWNTSKVNNMVQMFCGCSNLTGLDISRWDTSEVTSMTNMFCGCSNLEILNLSHFNTSKVTDMASMFRCDEKTPLLVITNDKKLIDYSYEGDNRILLKLTLKVDGDKVKFRDLGENTDKTEKYINIYETFTTTDNKEQILQKLKDRLETEKGNLVIAENYEFNIWKPEKDYEGKVSCLLSGVYIAMVEGKGTVIFDANSGTGTMPNQLLVSNKGTVLNKNVFTKEGYDFVTWNTKANGSGMSYSDEDKITLTLNPGEILTLYAQWEKKTEKPKTTGENYYSWSAMSNSGVGTSQDSSTLQTDKINTADKIKMKKTLRNIELPERLRTRKYLIGYPDENMKPKNDITKAEFATAIYRLINNGEDVNYNNLSGLNDVKTSDWFAAGVSYLLDKNIIKITDNEFGPNEVITRGEVAEILFNVFKFYDGNNNNNNYVYGNTAYNFVDENEFGRFEEAIKQLASNGIINGYENNKFEPNKNITRGELAKIIFMAFQRKYNPGKKFYYDLEKNNWAYNFLIDASE